MKKNNRKISKWDIMYWLTALVPFIISICFYNRLPDLVPTHWGRTMWQMVIPAAIWLLSAYRPLCFSWQ